MPDEKKVNSSPDGIRAIRKRLRLTQAELAGRLGYSRNYVTLLETGAKPITDEVAFKLTAMLTAATRLVAEVRETPTPYGCRIPSDCDLTTELKQMRAEMADMRGKLDTLLGLLGGPLRASIGLDETNPGKRAG